MKNMMVNLLIVDDEPLIVDNMKAFLELKEELNLNICTAYTGADAINWAFKMRIDILLTDISMPKMNGFEVKNAVTGMWPECKTIFLTAFEDFNYAISVIRNCGSDYILKNEDDELVINALKKCIDSIEAEEHNKEMFLNAKKQIEMAKTLFQRNLIDELLNGVSYQQDELARLFNDTNISLDVNDQVMILLGIVDDWGGKEQKKQKLELSFHLNSIVNRYLGSKLNIYCVPYNYNNIIWFIQRKSCDYTWNDSYYFLCETLSCIQNASRSILKVVVSFAAVNKTVCWNDIGPAYNIIDYKLRNAISVRGPEVIITVYSDRDNETEYNSRYMSGIVAYQSLQTNKINDLKYYIEKCDKESAIKTLNDIIGTITVSGIADKGLCYETLLSLALTFQHYINYSAIMPDSSELNEMMLLLSDISIGSVNKVRKYYESLIIEIFNKMNEYKANDRHVIMQRIEDYINQNISTDISLVDLADYVHLNSSYLSRLYKQISGEGLMQHVMVVKCRKAKELLAKRDMKVMDIADSLGFRSKAYFSYMFKKFSGITPREYRENLGYIDDNLISE